jgi:hypothetical protein
MRINEQTVRYPTEEIDEMRRRGEDRTAARLDAKSEAELEAAIDPDEEGDFDRSGTRFALTGTASTGSGPSAPAATGHR